MATTATLTTSTIELPTMDMSLLKTLASKFGWKILYSPKKSGLEEALEDEKNGRVYKAESVDDMFNQILD
jgi:hypothetical protein